MPRGRNRTLSTWLTSSACSLPPWGVSPRLGMPRVVWSGSEPGSKSHGETWLLMTLIFTPTILCTQKSQGKNAAGTARSVYKRECSFPSRDCPWGSGGGCWPQRDCQIFIFRFRYNPDRCKIEGVGDLTQILISLQQFLCA